MIRTKDAILLAYTKLRTRKIRLIVTIAISGLLISLLAGASFVARGAFKSVEDFNQEGFGKRYIVSAQINATSSLLDNQTVIDRAIALQKGVVAQKKALAKQMGLEYDPNAEQPAFTEYDSGAGKVMTLNPESPSAKQAMAEYLAVHPEVGLPELKKNLEKYNPTAYFESSPSLMSQQPPYLQVLKDAKESYAPQTKDTNFSAMKGLGSFTSSWGLMSEGLLEPFLLPDTDTKIGQDGSIPVVAPYTAVEELLKLDPLPPNASSEQKMQRLQDVRKGAPNLSFQVCYRNKTSEQSLTAAVSQQQEMAQNAKNKDYQKPLLINDVPSEACGPVRVTVDKRTAAEKLLAEKEKKFRQTFGEEPEMTSVMSFRVIGISPDPPTGASFGVSDLLNSLVGSFIGTSWYTPAELKESQPNLAKLFTVDPGTFGGQQTYYAELPDSVSARAVLSTENCLPNFTPGATVDPFLDCAKQGRYFMIMPFGSSSLALESAQQGFQKIFRIAAAVIAIIAALIMVGTIGRIIADSRRETAVFRAIGAKRLDIAQIYVTFTIFLTLLISLFAVTAGFIISQVFQARWADSLTIDALVIYNSQDLTKRFNLYAFEPKDLMYLVLLTVGAGLISAIIPLLSNLRRSPIKDMRDEN
jgi:hypothetical protein